MDLSPGVQFFIGQFGKLFFSPGSHFSLTSLAAAFGFALLWLVTKRVQRGRRIRLRTLWRAMFPRRITSSRSNYADAGYLFFNVFVFGIVLGWAILSYQFLSNTIISGFAAAFGPMPKSGLPVIVERGIITVLLFLAYEFGYWFNHWLSHRVPLLWEFHKVHHTATVLTPLTNFRVHPIYGLIFANILALSTGVTNGVANYMLGETAYQYAFSDTNIILVFFIHTYVHLQHTELWIPFSGALGRLFVSPAHHQVHHSNNPIHYDTNFGSCLAVWDWMFGTLYVPGKQPEKLSFGVDPDRPNAHTISGELVDPILHAGARLKDMVRPPAPLPVAKRERA